MQASSSTASPDPTTDSTDNSTTSSKQSPGNSFANPLIFGDSLAKSTEPTLDISKSDLDWPIALGKGTKTCTKHPLHLFLSYSKLSPTHKAFLTNLHTIPIPKTFSKAIGDKNWKNAMEAKMAALEKNQTWELVQLPKGKHPVGCKWVYAVKYRFDGSLDTCKARLVANGYTQVYRVDYLYTFASMEKLNTIRVLLSLAANLGWPLQQFDMKNAFLHVDLEEEVYMKIPLGYCLTTQEKVVCKLRKVLYGLK